MERLTERHCGVAVIKDKSKLKEAMEKLAAYEEAEDKKVRCKPGDMIWHIECDQYYGMLFMAECGDYIISCSEELLYENNFERQLEEMCFESLDFDGVSVYIHAKENVFLIKKKQKQHLQEWRKAMSRVLPILFNTEMVQAILDGRKTVTRRCIRYKYDNTEIKMKTDKYGTRLIEIQKDVEGETYGKNPDGSTWRKILPYIEKNPPCKKRDILYVRETWCKSPFTDNYIYRADGECELFSQSYDSEIMDDTVWTWKPSIHMPKEAARIFLKVKDVRVERLQDITEKQAETEGINGSEVLYDGYIDAREKFAELWDSTIKKSDIEKYGWNANPWVWVIEFERCEKPEEWDNGKS